MNELEVLRLARKLIERAEDWGQGSFYYGGRSCLAGAVLRAAGANPFENSCANWTDDPAIRLLRAEIVTRTGDGIPFFNDTHTHAEVLALLDDVIAKLAEQEYGSPLPPLPQQTTTLQHSEPNGVVA